MCDAGFIVLIYTLGILTSFALFFLYKKNKVFLRLFKQDDFIGNYSKDKNIIKYFDFIIGSTNVSIWKYSVKYKTFYSVIGKLIIGDEGTYDKWLNMICKDDRALYNKMMNDLLSGKISQGQIKIELLPNAEHKKIRLINDMISFKDESGKVVTIIGTQKNVTEEDKRIELLEKAKIEAEISSNLKSAFLSNMSHEIRTPLNAITGFADLIVKEEDIKRREEYSCIINRNSEQLISLITNILEMSKIESHLLQPKLVDFDLDEWFTDMEVMFKQRMVNSEVNFIAKHSSKEIIVHLDKDNCTQILINLVSNARKFTQRGEIVMYYEIVDQGVRINVKDTGIGISSLKQKNIFDRFYKINNLIHGNGLGLSISKAIVELNNGNIGFESTEGVGSLFWFWLPTTVTSKKL